MTDDENLWGLARRVRDGRKLVGIAAFVAALRLAWVMRSDTFPVDGMDMFFYDERA